MQLHVLLLKMSFAKITIWDKSSPVCVWHEAIVWYIYNNLWVQYDVFYDIFMVHLHPIAVPSHCKIIWFGMTFGWINNDRFWFYFILRWTIPSTKGPDKFHSIINIPNLFLFLFISLFFSTSIRSSEKCLLPADTNRGKEMITFPDNVRIRSILDLELQHFGQQR